MDNDNINKKGIFEETIDGLTNLTQTYLGVETVIPKLTTAVLENEGALRLLNKELGTGSKVSAALRGEMLKLSAATGIDRKAQMDLLNVTKDYHQSLNSTSKSTLLFIKASGAQEEIVGKLAAKLKILSNASESSFSGMYESILAVREEYGLTSEQIDNVATSLTKYISVTNKSSINMKEAAKNIALFTSKLTSAGVESDEVSEIIDKMLDPNKMMDSIMLFSKMGLTISDLTIGNPTEKLTDALPRLKQLGQQIAAEPNKIMANEWAKVYGINLEQAKAFAEIDLESTIKKQKTLQQYRNEVTSFANSVQDTFTMVGGFILTPINLIFGKIQKVTNDWGIVGKGLLTIATVWLGRTIFNNIKKRLKSIGQDIVNFFKKAFGGIGQAALDTSSKIADRISEPVNQYMSLVGEKADKKQGDVEKLKSETAAASEARTKAPKQEKTSPFENFGKWKLDSVIENALPHKEEKEEDKDSLSQQQKRFEIASNAYNGELLATKKSLIEKKLGKNNLTTNEVQKLEEAKASIEGIEIQYGDIVKTFNKSISSIHFGKDDEQFNETVALLDSDFSSYINKYKDTITNTLKNVLGDEVFGKIDLNEKQLYNLYKVGDVDKILNGLINRENKLSKKELNKAEKLEKKGSKIAADKYLDSAIQHEQTREEFKAARLEREVIGASSYKTAANLTQEKLDDFLSLIENSEKNIFDKTNVSNWDVIVAPFENFFNKAKETFKEAAGEKATEFIKGAFKGIIRFPGIIKNTVKDFPNALKSAKKSITNAIKNSGNLFIFALHSASKGVAKLIGNAISLSGKLIGGAINLAGKGLKGLIKLPGKLLGGIGKGIKGLAIGGLAAGGAALMKGVKENPKVQAALENLSGKFSAMWEGLSSKLIDPISNILDSGKIDGVIERVSTSLSKLIDNIVPALSGLVENIIPLVSTVIEWIAPKLTWIIGLATQLISWVSRGVIAVAGFFGKNIKDSQTSNKYLKSIDQNTTKEDIRTMQIGYATAESYSRGIIAETLAELTEQVKKFEKTVTENQQKQNATLQDASNLTLTNTKTKDKKDGS